ncbi:DUF4392 domain-containing protein [Paraglaciecola aquimarina]|uniref:DUF4392 domain-containing protein n=1 Tax=Paraglaciecola algarum TaxID=3050085 RepID=A0ABS9D4I5_9ALTE|nr:glutamate cyclase domain-containing protein [Paraglaciecola sp. G1-23]MCF2947796.1 DUF4392 domain-containing protein [Paraglaciecola sp. G1-23]
MITGNHYLTISQKIEDLLVQRNLRGMQDVQYALRPGYYLRAAKQLMACKETIIIGTGFPVADTFETDGPVGAIALYHVLVSLGKKPILVCGDPLYNAIKNDYDCVLLPINDLNNAPEFAKQALKQLSPDLIISIERPGLSEQNGYFNMRGENISSKCASFDYFLELAICPTIAIGDGGNEIGMGNIAQAIKTLDIVPSKTQCDELLIADVSNWAAYGLIAFLSIWHERNLFSTFKPTKILTYLSKLGSVDGVTRLNELTEDSLCVSQGEQLIAEFEQLCELI